MKFRKRALLAIMILFLLAAVCSSQMSPMPAEQTATVFGQSIHYYEAGQGPRLSCSTDWERMPASGGEHRPLSAHYHVIAPDQIGFDIRISL